ncbi:hypothetical protein SH501x_002851 [Pirellulaceae bacterium SH501]
MSTRSTNNATSLLLLDTAYFLLGGLVLFLVLTLLPLDDPNPLRNAWTYILGVPTALIALSMLTHVLSNEIVERSLQIGLLASVALHLALLLGARHWLLFSGIGSLDSMVQQETIQTRERRPPVYYQPSPKTEPDQRPDYLKPVPTESPSPETPTSEKKEAAEHAPLELATPSETLDSRLIEETIPLDRRRELTAEPELSSDAREWDRPNIATPPLPPSNPIEVPSLRTPEQPYEQTIAPKPLDAAQKANTEAASVSPELNPPLADEVRMPFPTPAPTFQPARRSVDREIAERMKRMESTPPNDRTADRVQMERPRGDGPSAPGIASTASPVPVPEMPALSSATSNAPDATGPRDTDLRSPKATRGPEIAAIGPLKPSMEAVPYPASGSDIAKRSERSLGGLRQPRLPSPELPPISTIGETQLPRKRPEPSGPRMAASSVPIPTPAFSQRIQRIRERETQASQSLGPLAPQTELAIERGLQFLAKHQRPDGSWHLEDFDTPVRMRSTTAATALGLLSFQGAGYTHRQFKYESVCKGAVDSLLRNQQSNGDLYQREDEFSNANAWLYSHAMATLALCEAYGMTQDESIKEGAQRAVNFLVDSQDPEGGGWRYSPRIGSDTSVTGWVMMSFQSAELAGLQVPKGVYGKIERWLENSQMRDAPYLYRYNWQANTPSTEHGRIPTPAMTSVGLLMRLYTGWKRDHPNMRRGTDWLLRFLPAEGTPSNPTRDTYYWYYATQVMFHAGGEKWKAWYGDLYPILIRTQLTDGDLAGSWDPLTPIPDAWGEYGGRLYVTTLNLLSLEVYYRHLPLYDATAE